LIRYASTTESFQSRQLEEGIQLLDAFAHGVRAGEQLISFVVRQRTTFGIPIRWRIIDF